MTHQQPDPATHQERAEDLEQRTDDTNEQQLEVPGQSEAPEPVQRHQHRDDNDR
jgi:hypothetical protein